MSHRTFKGNSIIAFPCDYTVIDLETTGLSSEYDAIIELCALKIRDGSIVDSFSSLVKPFNFDDFKKEYPNDFSYLPEFITKLTGITDDMLSGAPDIAVCFKAFLDFIGDAVLVGHNVNFDVNFIYDYSMRLFKKPFSNNFIDTMRLSRRLYTDMQHHRLSDIAAKCEVDYSGAHRAETDCYITLKCFQHLYQDVCNKYESIDDFCTVKHIHSPKLKASDIVTENMNFDIDNPLYQKVVVFTGTLEYMQRKEAMQYTVDIGGIVNDRITEKTNYLILADHVYNTRGGKSNKQKKVETLKAKGFDIEVMPESVFYDCINYVPNGTAD